MGECVAELARLVGPGGHAVGIDTSRAMAADARARPEMAALPATFLLADVHHLPFGPASFDACRAERLLVSVEDPRQALRELIRVVKPGGRVVVQDVDNATLFVDTPFPETTRSIVQALCDAEANGTIGRCLPRLFREQGLAEVEVSSFVLLIDYDLLALGLTGIVAEAQESGALSPDDARAWWDHLEEADGSGSFFAGQTLFVVAGTRPR
jgi:SAM-dependent methyltransferase